MKKLTAILLLSVTIFAQIPKVSAAQFFELWAQSPTITSGMTYEQIDIIRAYNLNLLSRYRLSRFGANYYLGVIEKRIKGGLNGKRDVSYLRFYTYVIDGNNIVVFDSSSFEEQYLQNRGVTIRDLANDVTDTAYYVSKGWQTPYYILQANSLVECRSFSGYNLGYNYEWLIISASGKLIKYTTSYRQPPLLMSFDGKLHQHQNGSKHVYPMGCKNDDFVLGTNVQYPLTADGKITRGQTEYPFSEREPEWGNIYSGGAGIPNKSNVFPDGRKVNINLTSIGGGLSEVWYEIIGTDGKSRGTGPTGYSKDFGNSIEQPDMKAIAINNTKFIVYVNESDDPFIQEYYRYSVLEQGADGNVDAGGGAGGNKNIKPPDTADTEPVQTSIDFGQTDLPLGFNVKENVINSKNLDSLLRTQINSITMNPITIVKKSGYIYGEQNVGVPVNYSYWDDTTLGGIFDFYTNGQYVYWNCYDPKNLQLGTHHKSYSIGNKTLYLTINVIAPPTNTGTTSVTI